MERRARGGRRAPGWHDRPGPMAGVADHGQRTAGRGWVPPPSRPDRVRPVRAHRPAPRRRPRDRHRRLRAAIDVPRVRPARQPVTNDEPRTGGGLMAGVSSIWAWTAAELGDLEER